MKWNWVFILFLLSFCKDSSAPAPTFPAGNFSGTSSFSANLSANDPLVNYETEYKAIREMGMRGAQTVALWGSLNPTGTTYDLVMMTNPFFGLTKLSDYGYETIFLNLPIIDVSGRSMPGDIASLSFDDPIVKARFRALIDVVKDQINTRVKYVALGNEVDTYLSVHPNEWTAYKNLVEDAKAYLKSLKPNLIVGVTTTFDGATSKSVAQVNDLNTNMDAVMLTYYPISTSFIVRDPGTVASDIAKMVDTAHGKQIIMQEWGYPSSSALGSSDAMQATFIYNSLVELEKQSPGKFPFVSFFKYRDWNTAHVQTVTGQHAGQPFFEFMSSLGLKKNDGTSKPAFDVIKSWIKP